MESVFKMKNSWIALLAFLLVSCASEKEVEYMQTLSFTVAENEVNVGMNQLGNILLMLPLDSILKANKSDIARLNKMVLIEAILIANDSNLTNKNVTEFRLDMAGDLAHNQPGKPFTLASSKEITSKTELKPTKIDISEMYSGKPIFLLPIGTFTESQPKPFSMKLVLKWNMKLGQ